MAISDRFENRPDGGADYTLRLDPHPFGLTLEWSPIARGAPPRAATLHATCQGLFGSSHAGNSQAARGASLMGL
jgi:hypothetical protein